MFMRIDQLQAELPAPKAADPNAAAALQELLGGKYGEMSTLGNYMFQSFNFRSKSKLRPFYSLVASITAEELGHVELVSNGVAMLANGPDTPDGDTGDGGDISGAPFEDMKDIRLAASSCQVAAVPCRSTVMAPPGITTSLPRPAMSFLTFCTTSTSNAARVSTSSGSMRP
jgi:Mn-containing catalase